MSLAIPNAGAAAAARRIERVVETLAREPGLTSQELAERLELTRRHASLLLLRLEETGLVAHEGRRWFPAVSGA
jgi:DNA-binding IclR family transcriptional regulator